MLAAIPSIIYGMWGLFVFVPLFQQYVQPHVIDLFDGIPILGDIFAGPPFGIGALTAGLILSIMVIPFIPAVMRDVFELRSEERRVGKECVRTIRARWWAY